MYCEKSIAVKLQILGYSRELQIIKLLFSVTLNFEYLFMFWGTFNKIYKNIKINNYDK